MPSRKDLKRLVRARMAKTGESYTTARAHITRTPLDLPPDHQTLAGAPDASLIEKTGRSWRDWVAVLDEAGATELTHTEIAAWIAEHHDIGSWWCQTVTVGYERIRGLRAVGQGRDGYFTVNRSRTLPFPAERLRAHVHVEALRATWLPAAEATPTGRGGAKDFRFACPDGTRGVIGVRAKGEARSTVTVQHTRLERQEDRERRRAFWTERIEALESALRND